MKMFFLKSINNIQTFNKFNKFILFNNYRTITTNISKCNQQARNDLFNRVLNFKKDSNQNSFFTTHMSIFLRRNRMFSRSNKNNLSKEELKKIKVNKSEIKRLLSLAKPEKYRLSLAMTLLIISRDRKSVV